MAHRGRDYHDKRALHPPEEISAKVDAYEVRYGKTAFRQIGDDMFAERNASGSCGRNRLLRSVSGELARRMVEQK
ncbi:hypothetical protein BOSE62_140001 [Bosea sp. 62]|nr:hypothetical protein BOSE62_140001 [Bosea sp. 62]